MTTTITGVLGQLAHQGEEVIGVIRCREDNRVVFIRVPAEVAFSAGELLTSGRTAELSGHLCDHGRYFVVTGAAAPT